MGFIFNYFIDTQKKITQKSKRKAISFNVILGQIGEYNLENFRKIDHIVNKSKVVYS